MRYLTLALLLFASLGFAQDTSARSQKLVNPAEIKTDQLPVLPACMESAPLRGDPSKEASVIYAKGSANCSIPWHWHSPVEEVMMITGTARVEMKDGAAHNLKAGGYALFPSKMVHQFTCTTQCSLYVVSDSTFDIHYVDKAGNEIPPEKALKHPGKPRAGGSPAGGV